MLEAADPAAAELVKIALSEAAVSVRLRAINSLLDRVGIDVHTRSKVVAKWEPRTEEQALRAVAAIDEG